MIKRKKEFSIEDKIDNFMYECESNDSQLISRHYANAHKELFSKKTLQTIENFDYWMNSLRNNNTWIGVSGSWRMMDQNLINEATRIFRTIVSRGKGIITGGALGVGDYLATEIVLKEGNPHEQLRIILPVDRVTYTERYQKAVEENIITRSQADHISSQLLYIDEHFKEIIFDDTPYSENKFLEPNNFDYRSECYDFRNFLVAYGSDGLLALCVNESGGVLNTVGKIRFMNKPFKAFFYTIDEKSPHVIREYDTLNIPNLNKKYPLPSPLNNPVYVTQDKSNSSPGISTSQ